MASSSTTPSTRPSTSRSTGKAPDRPASLRSTPAAAMTATAGDTVLEAILRRDRRVAAAALIVVIAMAWLWILLGAGTGTSAMDVIVGPSPDHMASIMAPALRTAGYAGVWFRMGLEHGSFCLGCCWFLMGLLFFGGIMNLFWIAGLAAFVLLEKTVPMGSWIGRIVGVGVAAWGVLLLATTTLTIAGPNEYGFEVVGAPTGVPGKTTVAVRLVHASDNKPVDEAAIVEAKTDMGPAGMAEMSGKVTPAASDHPGVFRFSIETGMAGQWELVLTAAVPGEPAPVTGKVIYNAK